MFKQEEFTLHKNMCTTKLQNDYQSNGQFMSEPAAKKGDSIMAGGMLPL